MSNDEAIEFSRTNRLGEKLGELRTQTLVKVLDVLDMVAISETKSSGKMVSRTDIVNRVLMNFVQSKIDEAILINQAISGNPTVLEE